MLDHIKQAEETARRIAESDATHPNVHSRWRQWSADQTLHVAVAYSNPLRWRVRRQLMHNFRKHMEDSPNVCLWVGELAYGDRPHEVTLPENPRDIQFRTEHELWHKENLANQIIRHWPADWKYGAVIDGDFLMTRPDWALEAIHQLQHYAWVQLFSSYACLSASHRPHRLAPSFTWNCLQKLDMCVYLDQISEHCSPDPHDSGTHDLRDSRGKKIKAPGATGGAWAFTRDGLKATGGFLETCILGSADWHMAFGLSGQPSREYRLEMVDTTAQYVNTIRAWQRKAARLTGNIGCVDNHAIHYFHGSMLNRAYGDRWKILAKHRFDPMEDLVKGSHGILQLTPDKPGLRDDIRTYFRQRNEDDPSLRGSETELI